MAWNAVIAGMPRQAPASKLHLVGEAHGLREGRAMYSAAVPNGPLPLAVPDPDALADAGLRHAVANRVNRPRSVAMRYHARE